MKRNIFAAIFTSFILVFAACGANAADKSINKSSVSGILRNYFSGDDHVHLEKCSIKGYNMWQDNTTVDEVTFVGNKIEHSNLPTSLGEFSHCWPIMASLEISLKCVNVFNNKDVKNESSSRLAKFAICEDIYGTLVVVRQSKPLVAAR